MDKIDLSEPENRKQGEELFPKNISTERRNFLEEKPEVAKIQQIGADKLTGKTDRCSDEADRRNFRAIS